MMSRPYFSHLMERNLTIADYSKPYRDRNSLLSALSALVKKRLSCTVLLSMRTPLKTTLIKLAFACFGTIRMDARFIVQQVPKTILNSHDMIAFNILLLGYGSSLCR